MLRLALFQHRISPRSDTKIGMSVVVRTGFSELLGARLAKHASWPTFLLMVDPFEISRLRISRLGPLLTDGQPGFPVVRS